MTSPGPPPPRPSSPSQPLDRRVLIAAATVTLAGLVIALVAVIVLAGRVRSLEDRIDEPGGSLLDDRIEELEAELEQVAGAGALVTAQALELQANLAEAAPTLRSGLDEAIAGLEEFAEGTIAVLVPLDQTVPIETEILLQRQLTVPIDEVISIEQTVDTTITVEGPLGLAVPVDVSVPVDLDVPVRLDVDIPVDETVPVATEVDIALEVPLSIEVAETELAPLVGSLADGLRSLRSLADQLD